MSFPKSLILSIVGTFSTALALKECITYIMYIYIITAKELRMFFFT